MRSPSDTDADRRLADGANPWLALAVVLGVATLVSVWQTPQRINHDCAGYLQQAEMLLNGAVPYCDFVDTNPPLSTYLNVPPVWLARNLNLPPILVFQGLVIGLLFVSAVEIHLLLRHRRSGLRPAEQGLVLVTWMAMFFLVDWRGDVGQREHLFVLLYVPYLFLRVLRHRRGSVAVWFTVLLGLQAGLVGSLKPHFLVAALAVEIALLLASRRWRTVLQPECFAFAGVVTAYVGHWLFVPPAMREAFFGRWLPLICRTYRAFDASYSTIGQDVLASPLSAAGLVGVLAAVLLLFMRRRLPFRLHLLALATFGVMGLALLYVQHKGFTYHRIPFDTAALLCLATVALSGTKRRRASNIKPQSPLAIWGPIVSRCLMLGVFCGLLVAWLIGRPGSARPDTQEYAALRRIVEQRTRPGDRVLVVATSTRPAYPMLTQLDRRPASRYLATFPIALLYAGAEPTTDRPVYRRYDEAPAEERWFLDELREDVMRLQPRLIIVNATAGWVALPKGFNTFEYLCYSGWTRQALKPYREVPGPQGWKVFERTMSMEAISKAR